MLIITDVEKKSRAAMPMMTRRGFLQAIGAAFACRLRPIAVGFTAIADELVWSMRWCCFEGVGLRFAGAK